MATVFLIMLLLLLVSTGLSQGGALPLQSRPTSPPTEVSQPLSQDMSTSPSTNTLLPSSSIYPSTSASSKEIHATTTSQHALVWCRPTITGHLGPRTNRGKPLSRNLWLIAFLCIAICIVVGPLVMLIAKCLPPAHEAQISNGMFGVKLTGVI
ncbi:hypothetical protein ACEWY4_014892 [Coilia grayii]|uniref:Uncharacterized protein n=1 Tax=Coilia grayii TaxID=363190 RepID=A0ABD1JTI4_9TELE